MSKRYQPSLRFYVVLLVGLVLASVSLFSWLVTQQVRTLVRQTQSHNDALASEELRTTLTALMAGVASGAQRLAEWDETLLQFRQPSYYGYWRDQRAREAGLSPVPLSAVELYGPDGLPLSRQLIDGMRDSVSKREGAWWLSRDALSDQARLYHLHAVQGRGKHDQLIGYVAVAVDLRPALVAAQRFRHIDVSSLAIEVSSVSFQEAGDLIPYIWYRLAPNLPFQEMQAILRDTLWRFGVLATALLLLSVYLLVALGSLPLARLSRYIDRLGRADVGATELPRSLLPLAEFDTVRGSLVDFQERLDLGASALRDSETRMRAVLHNVVDGILTFDVDGYISSGNPAVERLFGREVSSLLGQHVLGLFDGLSVDEFKRMAAELADKSQRWGAHRQELSGVHQDGHRFPAELTLSRLELPGSLSFIAVVENISERKEAEQRLKYLANFDPLTGLPNRTLLRDRLEHAMRQAERSELLVGVLFLDLDRFKNINDTLGHHAGDELLKVVAERLRGCVRSSDTVARLGGDEFMVVVENMRHVDEAAKVANAIRASFEDAIKLEQREVFVTPSIGITFYPLDDSTADALLRNADSAMYRAKALGGDGVQFFTQALNEQAAERLALENNLRQALMRQQFALHYQPRVCAHTGETFGVEALLRWQHPEMGAVSPDRFIPVLEDTGQIDAVGAWVLQRACEQNMAWRRAGLAPMRVAVNIAVRQIRSGHLIPLVDRVLAETGLPGSGLELEITESAMIENVDDTVTTLQALKARGVHIALDDFGTGYSALGYLRRLPIDTLKIDRTFIKDVPSNADDARVASALVAIASSLDLSATAEGVETEEQLAFLQHLGCNEIQGFLFSRPLPADELVAWLQARTADIRRITP